MILTKSEAKEELNNGEKISHLYFTDDEWIVKKDGKIVDEKGYFLDEFEFWFYRTHPNFDTNWFIIK